MQLMKRDAYFWVTFDHFWSNSHFLGRWTEAKIDLSLNPSHQNLVKLVRIRETLCRSEQLELNNCVIVFACVVYEKSVFKNCKH